MFQGGEFHQRLAPPRACSAVNFSDPQPSLMLFPPNQNTWFSTDGDGDISPGVVIGECAFLSLEAAGFLHPERGITCALTPHRVRLRGQSPHPSPARFAPSSAFHPSGSPVELGATQGIGVRHTIHCDVAA